jgi:hypothetical protein
MTSSGLSEKRSIAAGIVIGGAFLFQIILALAWQRFWVDKEAVVAISAVGLIAGAAVVVFGMVLKGLVRNAVLSGIGLLVLILGVSLAWQGVGPASAAVSLWFLYGRSGFLAVGFTLMMLTLPALRARPWERNGLFVRLILGCTAGFALLMFFVQILIALSDKYSVWASYGPVAAFHSDDAICIIYGVIVLLALLSFLTIGIVAAAIETNLEKLVRAGIIIVMVLLWTGVAFTVAMFIKAMVKENAAAAVLDLLRDLAGVLFPIVTAVYLLYWSLGSVLIETIGLIAAQPAVLQVARVDAPAPSLQPLSPAPQPSPAVSNIEQQLLSLRQIRDAGLLTEDEFQKKKEELLRRL